MRSWISLLSLIILCAWASPAHAWMWEVSDAELADVTGEGFSSFTIQDDIARAQFNISMTTYTEIDSLKMGYYDNGSTTGWDEDWTNVSLGSSSTSLVCKGLFIEAGYTNITDADTRTLNYVKMGTPSMTGPITADFNSFTGRIDRSGSTILDVSRQDLGNRTITSYGGEFSITLHRETGWSSYWGDAEISIP